MRNVSSWAGIESVPETGAGAASPGVTASGASGGSPRRRWRLRRQPRPVLGSLDTAGVLVQRHAREVIVGSAWILLPGLVVGLVATTLAFDRYQSLHGAAVSVPELLGGQQAATGVEELLWFVGVVIGSLAACLVGGFVATLVVQHSTEQPLRVRAGYRTLAPRLPALTIAWLLGHAWFPLVVLLLHHVSGGGLALLAVFGSPLVLVAVAFTLLAAPAIVIEGLGPIGGLRRAWRLARARFGLLFRFVLASIVIGLLVQYGIAYLPRLLQATGLISFGRFGWLIEGVAGQLGRLISTPLVATATAIVYLDVRMAAEGMDLLVDAELAFGSPG
jgi:hypothetical protein